MDAVQPGKKQFVMTKRSVFQEFCHLEQGLCFLFWQDTGVFQKFPFKNGGIHRFGILIQKFGERDAEAGEQFLQDVNGGLVFASFNLVDIIFGHIGFFGKTVYAESFVAPQLLETVWNVDHGCHPFLSIEICSIGNLLETDSRPNGLSADLYYG